VGGTLGSPRGRVVMRTSRLRTGDPRLPRNTLSLSTIRPLPSFWPPATTIPARLGTAALRAFPRIWLPVISIPEARTGGPFFGSRSRKIPGPALPTILFPATWTSSIGCPRSAARMCSPAAVRPRAPESVLPSTRSPIGPNAEITSRCPPDSVESVTAMRPVIPPDPVVPAPIRTFDSGDPSIVSRLRVVSWAKTLTPYMRFAAGTVM
jgi:hypothetical protein